MSGGFFKAGFRLAWHLLAIHDGLLYDALDNTIRIAIESTAIAAIIGIPLGVLLALGRFRGRGFLLAVANAGLGLPPVVVGIVLTLLFLPEEQPFGRFHLVFTLNGVIIAQAVLAFPVVVALTASAVNSVTPGLLDQARAFDARLYRVWLLAIREARIGILAAIIAGVGSAVSEVAAVALVGGNIEQYDQTLASLALEKIDAGDFAYGFAVGVVLIALILIISILLTAVQYVGRRSRGRR